MKFINWILSYFKWRLEIRLVRTFLDEKLIIDIVGRYFQLKGDYHLKNTRERKYLIPRQIAISLILKYINDSNYSNVGRLFKKDHATIMHSNNVFNNMMETNKRYHNDVVTIESNIIKFIN